MGQRRLGERPVSPAPDPLSYPEPTLAAYAPPFPPAVVAPAPGASGLATPRGTPAATVARLPVYLRVLTTLADQGIETVSSGALARSAGVNPAQLRKDLSYLGSYGTRGVGYDVDHLRGRLGEQIGSSQLWPVIIVGLGNLGRALAHYAGFGSRGFRIVALVDADPGQVGRRIDALTITDIATLGATVAETGARIAVIATPAEVAQDVCDRLVAAGVSSILNFAPCVLDVPEPVTVRKVDLGQELQILAYHEQRRADPTARSTSPGAHPASVAVAPTVSQPVALAVGGGKEGRR